MQVLVSQTRRTGVFNVQPDPSGFYVLYIFYTVCLLPSSFVLIVESTAIYFTLVKKVIDTNTSVYMIVY